MHDRPACRAAHREPAHWRRVASDAEWASTDVNGRLAVIGLDGTLRVDDDPIGYDVSQAAWSPA